MGGIVLVFFCSTPLKLSPVLFSQPKHFHINGEPCRGRLRRIRLPASIFGIALESGWFLMGCNGCQKFGLGTFTTSFGNIPKIQV